MARKVTKEEKVSALETAGITLTGEETVKDLDALMKEHNVVVKADEDEVEEEELSLESLDKRVKVLESGGNVRTGASHISAPAVGITPVAFDAKKHKGAKSSVSFKVNDVSTPSRTFTEADHGENFEEIANEFHKNNEHKIISRTNDEEEA